MIDIRYILKDLIKCKSIQEFINNRYKNDEKIILDKNGIFNIIGTKDGLFYLDDMYVTIEQATKDYDYSDLRSTDIVLDIGACIGGFSIPISKKVKTVYAIEPIMDERLIKNIALNKIKNINVHRCALGEGLIDLNWCGYTKIKKCVSLKEIISGCNSKIDFLKCDCEGGEWVITPEDLTGIRRIEMEVHCFDNKHSVFKITKILTDANFTYSINIINENISIIHARSLVIK